jgi:hypothetical protein
MVGDMKRSVVRSRGLQWLAGVSIATAMLAGTSSAAGAEDLSPGLDASLPAATAMLGSWVPWSTRGVKVLTAAELTAHGAELANGASGSRVWDCWRETPAGWACAVRLFLAGGAVDLHFTIERELGRQRRDGRWVGPWLPTGRMAVTNAALLRAPARP